MQDTKELNQIKSILLCLIDNDVITTKTISKEVNISEKTVRLRLKALNEILKDNDWGSIETKTRVGIWLNKNTVKENELRGFCFDVGQHNKNQLNILKGYFLQNFEKPLTLEQLAQKVYLSIPSVSRILDEVAIWFYGFDLILERKPNKGHWVEGAESDYRNAFKQYLLDVSTGKRAIEVLKSESIAVNYNLIEDSIIKIERKCDIKLADKAYDRLLIMLTLYVTRSKAGFKVEKQEDLSIANYSEYTFCEDIISEIAKKEELSYDKNEVMVVAKQLLTNFNINNRLTVTDGYDVQLVKTVNRIIEIVSDILNINLKHDLALKESLIMHLRPAIFRMKYSRQNHNDNTYNEVKEQYKTVFRAVWSTSIILEDEYQVQVNETEITYIALYFLAALERIKKPVNFVLVSSQPNSLISLIIEKIKNQIFPDAKIKVVSQREFISSKVAIDDVVITTENLNNNNYIRISNNLSNSEIRSIYHKVREAMINRNRDSEKFDPRCHLLFEPHLIMKRANVESKEEAITLLTRELEKSGYVTPQFLSTVLAREEKTTTSIGNSVAIPHGNQNEVNQAKVAILVLDEPVQWNDDKVRVVFLLAMRMITELEAVVTKAFYQQYIKLVSSDQKVESIFFKKSALEIYKYLIR